MSKGTGSFFILALLLIPVGASLVLVSCAPALTPRDKVAGVPTPAAGPAPAQVSVSAFDGEAKAECLKKYAPQVWLHSKEEYWPSSVEWSFHFLDRVWDKEERWWRLRTKEPMSEPSSVLPYFHGADPKKQWTPIPLRLDEVPAYAFWHRVDAGTVDLVYLFYYPYNRGKSPTGTVFGNHVGDWEHVTVRLLRQQDGQGRWALEPPKNRKLAGIHLAAHDTGASYPWGNVPKVSGTQHPIIYTAWGSHASYLTPGDHRYETILHDLTDKGTAWDTWQRLQCFDWDAKKGLGPSWKGTWPKWLETGWSDKNLGNSDPLSGPVYEWGNRASGRVYVPENWKFWQTKFWKPTYEWRLKGGPTGPARKDYFKTPALD